MGNPQVLAWVRRNSAWSGRRESKVTRPAAEAWAGEVFLRRTPQGRGGTVHLRSTRNDSSKRVTAPSTCATSGPKESCVRDVSSGDPGSPAKPPFLLKHLLW